MPTYFRKRPGSKNFKANVTQKGLSSFTLTNAARKAGLRVNYNTKRGLSFSVPGTGLSWRSKSYANQRQSAAQKRGYDLRTKEGKEKHAKLESGKTISLVSTMAGFGGWWLLDTPHGLWIGYFLFWILWSSQEKSILTLIWAIFAHFGAAIGYLLSKMFIAEPLEFALWGSWVASFLFSFLFGRLGEFIFALIVFVGIWAFLGQPLTYFEQIPLRLGFDNDFTFISDFIVLNSLLNIYGLLILFFGIVYYLHVNSSLINRWNSSKFVKVLAKISHFFLFTILLPLSCLLYPFVFFLLGAQPDKVGFSSYPMFFLMALGYSVTFGLLVNRAILNKENHNTNLQTSLILCFLSFYWLPLFAGKLSKTVDVQKNSPRKLGARAYETSDISDDEYEAIVRNVKGVGQVKIKALINEFPSVHSFLNASDDEISRKTQRLIGRSLSNNIREEILNRVEI